MRHLRNFLTFCLVLFLLTPGSLPMGAHGSPYFEFNPDPFTTSPLTIVGSPTVNQLFIPQNDFLGGFDLWVSNNSTAGSATFTLLNSAGTVLATRTVTIPAIADVTGGQRFHVDLSAQLAVTSNAVYRIQISTSNPSLKLYYAPRVRVIQQNAPASQYQSGAAMIGGEEKEFSFKFALYEYSETAPPVLSNISITSLNPEQVRINYNSTEPVDHRIEYGPEGQAYTQSTDFIGSYTFCTPGVSFCDLVISVSPGTAYAYRLTAKDIWGNTVQVTGTFTSEGILTSPTPTPSQSPTPTPTVSPTPSDVAGPPIISNLRIAQVTHNSVAIAWDTNEAANSFLLISTPTLITIGAADDNTLELVHWLQVGGLNPDTIYLAKASSNDVAGDERVATISFSTLVAPTPTPSPTTSPASSPPPGEGSPTPTPVPSGEQSPGPTGGPTPTPSPSVTATSGGGGSVTISWNPGAGGEPSGGYRIDIFDANKNLIKTIYVPAGIHETTVTGIPNGDHQVIVYADENGAFKKLAPPTNITPSKPFLERIYDAWPYLLAGLVIGVGALAWLAWRQRHKVEVVKIPPQGGRNLKA